MEVKDGKKYIFTFLITVLIFGTAIFASDILNKRKVNEVREIEDHLALDILSSETQFSLLEETSCKDIKNTFLSKELGTLSEKLSYTETQSGFNGEDVDNLKRYYSLLQIKDYLLMKRITEKCAISPTFILYFYSTDPVECEECLKTGYVLTALQEKYPDVRIYSFDYNLDLEAIKTLLSIYKVEYALPALIINGDPYYGFRTLEDLESTVPALSRLKTEYDKKAAASSTPATSTPRR